MSDLHWMRWRRYPGGPLQRWHLVTGRGDAKRTVCGAAPGEYAVSGDERDAADIPQRVVCATCAKRHADVMQQAKGWTA